MENLKVRFKTLTWKFKDTTIEYPGYGEIPKRKITAPQDFFEMFKPLMAEQAGEVFLVAWLSTSNRVQGFDIISTGLLNSSLVHPREVFRRAVVANCAAILLGHNHPSENPEPSNEDISITKKIVEAGKILDIPVFDHIIFAGETYTSFVERRII